MQHLIYLHGFLSSPQSEKAQLTLRYIKTHFPGLNFHCPQLLGDINKSVALVDALVTSLSGNLRFIGSSMGGFLSTYFVEKYGKKHGEKRDARAVIVNPAVEPFNLLSDYMGKHVNPYSNEVFYISEKSIEDLKSFYYPTIRRPANYKVLLQTGDETLDYRLACKKYAGADFTVEQGGSHAFENYDAHLPAILRFLQS
uniref:YqiA/YcfP family alpha/beta fold hydrolase n=1 Tax=Ningiella ruwaisensis TaxID=2364274 RepID=UPI0010A076CB|nr:YqiA/YcfP family alpha/beta fold hydrolase [Ningiella ruwaisensis]